MSDLLEIAGGKALVLQSAYDCRPEPSTEARVTLRTARERFIAAFSANIEAKLQDAHTTHIMMNGDRPEAPSDDAEAWDDDLISAADAVTSRALEPFGLWSGEAATRWAQALDTFSVLDLEWEEGAHTLAEFIWRERIETKDSTGKQLSALGITAKDIEGFWAAQGPIDAPAPVAAPTAEAIPDAAPVQPVTPQGAVKKTRGRKRAHVSLTLPSGIFEALRAVGVKDNVLSEATGIKRPTVSRVCAGIQDDIGISSDEFAKLKAFAEAKAAELQGVIMTLECYEAAA